MQWDFATATCVLAPQIQSKKTMCATPFNVTILYSIYTQFATTAHSLFLIVANQVDTILESVQVSSYDMLQH